MKRVTLDDIAKQVNVTKATVSKVLNDKPGISDELRNKVLIAAKELGYRKMSGKLTESQKIIVCLISPKITSPHEAFYTVILNHIIRHSKDFNFLIIPYILTTEEIKNVSELDLLTEIDVEGILVLGQVSEAYLQEIVNKEIPICLVDFYNDTLGLDSVTTNNIEATYNAVKQIITRYDSKNFVFIGDLNTTSSLDRYLGFKRALLEYQVVNNKQIDYACDLTIEDLSFEDGVADCIICINDYIAFKLITQLTNLGFSIPKDMKVLGFDNTLHSELSVPKLSTINVDKEKMAIAGLHLLSNRMKNKTLITQRQYIHSYLIDRDSLGESY